MDSSNKVNAKQDYDKASQHELIYLRWKTKKQEAIISELEDLKLTLEGLLSQSKVQCDIINKLYSNSQARQSWYLKENQMLETQRAELSLKIEDQDRLLQLLMREKDKVEMELKDALHKSKCARMDTSKDKSYTEDKMLTKLGSFKDNLTEDILDQEVNLGKENLGLSNMSIYQEPQMSLSVSRMTECMVHKHTQTDFSFK